tara:strand:- start:4868 stop:5749 length:882 start_codon:yes stop_codon:yes gene_type:complete
MEEVKKAAKAKKFSGEDRIVIVKPIMRARNPLVSDPEHEAFYLFGNSTITYCLPVDNRNNLIKPFLPGDIGKEEQEWLEYELDLDLNWHKNKDNEWHKLKVKLGKETIKLNLKSPKDYMLYIILRANTLFIAPDGDSMMKKKTYRYALIAEEYETSKLVNEADKEMEAFMALGKLKDDKEAMINFLKVYGKKVSGDSKEQFLFGEIRKIISNDIDTFLNIMKDTDSFDIKLLISSAVDAGVVIKQGRKYSLPGGDPLCGESEVATLDVAVKYLLSPAQQDLLVNIQARTKNSK